MLERLASWGRCPILLATAPAGYGKTTALAEWSEHDPRPFAWLTLSPRDDDAVYLARRVATALDLIEPVDPSVFDALSGARPGISPALVPRLAASLADRTEPFVLVLDDLHLLSEAAAIEVVEAIADNVPDGSQLALAGRHEPALRVGRLRSQGRLAELDRGTLAMTRSEIESVLDRFGIDLGPQAAARLGERTDGWPVAVYLAARLLEDATDRRAALAAFRGDDRFVADYLRDEMLSSIDDELVEFLTDCSVLDHLDGAACDAVLGLEGSAGILRRLSRANLLVIPLDHADREYRYHSLLREMLLSELERQGSSRITELRRRASLHHHARGEVDRAIEQAVESGDVELAGMMLATYAAELASHGRVATLDRALSAFNREQITETPTLALARITSAIVSGEGAEIDRLAAAIDRNLDRVPEDARARVRTAADLVRVVSATSGGLDEMAAAAAAARELLPDDDPWMSLAFFAEGTAAFLDGDNSLARKLLQDGARHGDGRAPTLRIVCLAQLAVVALADGSETDAWSYEEHATASLERYGAADYPTQVLGPAVAALVRARRGRTDDAFAAARRAVALLARLPGVSAWYEAETRIVLARAYLALDDLGSVRTQLDDASEFLRAIPDAPVLHRMFEETCAAADAAEAGGGRWPLTPAELRLLHLLPTHLSFREIAEQLYVSTNTVKSQARSIYRKLGAASRAEAVAVARAGGLVTDVAPELREVGVPALHAGVTVSVTRSG